MASAEASEFSYQFFVLLKAFQFSYLFVSDNPSPTPCQMASRGEYACQGAAFSSRFNSSPGHKHRCGPTKPQPTLKTCYEDTIAAAHSAWTYYPADHPRRPEGRRCRHSPPPRR